MPGLVVIKKQYITTKNNNNSNIFQTTKDKSNKNILVYNIKLCNMYNNNGNYMIDRLSRQSTL